MTRSWWWSVLGAVVVRLVVGFVLVLVDPDPLPKSCTKAAKLLGLERRLSRLELYCQ